MAQITQNILLETELMTDALSDLEKIFQHLVSKHGPQYRELERRLTYLTEGAVCLSAPEFHHLEDARYILSPPTEISAIIRDAKALGVI